MTKSRVEFWNQRPMLFVNDELIPACAYITYFPERNCYADFVKEGYRIFSVNASFTGLPINSGTGFAPFTGIFDNPDCPDYTAFDMEVEEIIKLCPDAYIFPRINVSMPQKWVEEHLDDTLDTKDGNRREVLFSDAFRKDAAMLLRQFIHHVQNSDYSEHMIGYQISGGGTQEWFHFDGQQSLEKAREYVGDASLEKRLEFLSHSVTETISYFAHVVKEETKRQQVVGTFYGYTMEVLDPTWGTHGMEQLLDCPDIDFFCSPVSYKNMRALGFDWTDMGAVQSIQLHGKMYFTECDIRTCLSEYPNKCRPGIDPNGYYCSAIWRGPDTIEKSVSAIRKAYAHQFIRGNALWWFDMWGGWYAHPMFMREMKRCQSLMTQEVIRDKESERAQVAVFVDETLYRRISTESPYIKAQSDICIALGQSGVPYDVYLLCDAKECEKYRAVILPVPVDSLRTLELKKMCEKYNIPLLQCTPEKWQFTSDELRDFFKSTDVWCYCESNDVFGIGNGYFYIHAAEKGRKSIRFPAKYKITYLCGDTQEEYTDTVSLTMKQYETAIFKITK